MIIAANWKMHFSPKDTQDFFNFWSDLLKQNKSTERETVFFVPASNWSEASKTQVTWGIQNFFPEDQGAFTGENSPVVAKEMGATWALIGHSERRNLFKEDNVLINKKVLKALQIGLKPMLCVGESLQQRQSGEIEIVLQEQIKQGLLNVTPNLSLHIAYEPVWAIGTGLTANTQDIFNTHRTIQQILEDLGFSKKTPILYGGSVKPENSHEILNIDNVSGLLVGGASLKPDSFFKILTS
jgi:triosephosphate isomerase